MATPPNSEHFARGVTGGFVKSKPKPWWVAAQVIVECAACGKKFFGQMGVGPKAAGASEISPMDASACATLFAASDAATHAAREHPGEFAAFQEAAKAFGRGKLSVDEVGLVGLLRFESNLCNYAGAEFNVDLPGWPDWAECAKP